MINKLPPNRYIGHSHPSASGFSPGLIPHSQPLGGSNWDSLPWPPPCRRAVTERDLTVAGWRTQRTARRRAPACLIIAISKGIFSTPLGVIGVVAGRNGSIRSLLLMIPSRCECCSSCKLDAGDASRDCFPKKWGHWSNNNYATNERRQPRPELTTLLCLALICKWAS